MRWNFVLCIYKLVFLKHIQFISTKIIQISYQFYLYVSFKFISLFVLKLCNPNVLSIKTNFILDLP